MPENEEGKNGQWKEEEICRLEFSSRITFVLIAVTDDSVDRVMATGLFVSGETTGPHHPAVCGDNFGAGFDFWMAPEAGHNAALLIHTGLSKKFGSFYSPIIYLFFMDSYEKQLKFQLVFLND